MTFGVMYRKGAETRDTRLSLRIPGTLKQAITRYAKEDRRTVADVVILMLEEIVEIERIRRMSEEEVKLEWKKIGAGFARSRASKKAARRAVCEATQAVEAAKAARKGGKP